MEYLNSLSKNDLVLLLEIIHDVKAASNKRQFQDCLNRLKQLLFYDGSACLLSDMDSIRNGKPVFNQQTDSIPEAYFEHYAEERRYEKCTVFKAALKTNQPLNWKTIWKEQECRINKSLMAFAHAHGYYDGWIISNTSVDDRSVTVFLIAGKKVETDERTAAILKCLAPHYAESQRRISYFELRKQKNNQQYKLTPRELDVLRWIMDGKSTWDISVIFGRSQRVVKWHVNNIMQKLCAQNRTHAVAIAMQQGLI